MEYALGLTGAEHIEYLSVLHVDIFYAERRVGVTDSFLRIADNGQGSQAEEVHLEQTKLLKSGHCELSHYRFIIAREGHI